MPGGAATNETEGRETAHGYDARAREYGNRVFSLRIGASNNRHDSHASANAGAISVSELAQSLGWASDSAFSNAFKRRTGLAPKHFQSIVARMDGARVGFVPQRTEEPDVRQLEPDRGLAASLRRVSRKPHVVVCENRKKERL